MGRKIGSFRLGNIEMCLARDPKALGPTLGKLVITNNVPVEVIASVFQVSKPTVYRWMYNLCMPQRDNDLQSIRLMITILRKAKRQRALPLTGTMPERVVRMQAIVKEYQPRTGTDD